MRTRASLDPPSTRPQWSDDDDETFTRTRAALSDALDELDLPEGTPDETIKLVRYPDSF